MQLDLRLAVRQSYSVLRKRGHSSPPTPLQLDYARRIAESKRVVTAAAVGANKSVGARSNKVGPEMEGSLLASADRHQRVRGQRSDSNSKL